MSQVVLKMFQALRISKQFCSRFSPPWVCATRGRINSLNYANRHCFSVALVSPRVDGNRLRIPTTLIWGGILSFLGKKEEEKPESELIMTMKRGILAMQQGDLKKSEQLLHVALKIAQEQQNEQAVTYIYDIMANVAYEGNEYDKAEKLFVVVMQRLLGGGETSKDSNEVIHMSLKLADMYDKKGDKSKADDGFKFCVDTLEKKIEAGDMNEDTLFLYAMCLDWYAKFVFELGKNREAFKYFEKAYNMCVKLNGHVHEHSVTLLNDLGTICCLEQDYDGALKYLTEAVSVGKQLKEVEDLAYIYINLGTVYMKKKMFEEAKRAFTDGRNNAQLTNNKTALDEANICLSELLNA